MTAVPTETPVTMPLTVPTEPTAVLPLLQVPPDTPSDNNVVIPVQTLVTPVIGVGAVATFIVVVTMQLALVLVS